MVVGALVASTFATSGAGAQDDSEVDAREKRTWRSDTFDARNLSIGGWDVSSPAGRGFMTVSNGILTLLPSGSPAAETWREHLSLQMNRDVPDTDVNLNIRYGIAPTIPYEAHGVVFSNNSFDWLRFDVSSDPSGTGHRFYAASSFQGTPFIHANRAIDIVAPFEIQVRRLDHQWTAYLVDSTGDTELMTSFIRPMTVQRYGPFASSRGVRGQAEILDIIVEDAPVIVFATGDTTAPLIQGTSVVELEGAAQIEWFTDERTTGSARLITEDGAVETFESSALSHEHRATFFSPGVNTQYTVEIDAVDITGNQSSTTILDQIFVPQRLPLIEVYGPTQRVFGTRGLAQETINISGRTVARDRQLGATTVYRIDGGNAFELFPPVAGSRLAGDEEWNIVLEPDDIAPGGSTITIEAADIYGFESSTEVRVRVENGSFDEPDLTIDWDDGTLDELAQPVTGDWRIADGFVSPHTTGPERTLVIGNETWANYEVSFDLVLEGPAEFDPDDPDDPWVGAIFGWRGTDPRDDRVLLPISGRAVYGLFGSGTPVVGLGDELDLTETTGAVELEQGQTHHVRAQAESDGRDTTLRIKVWPDDFDEPEDWVLVERLPDTPSSGALALVAHRWDARFGPVTVTPLDLAE